MKMIRPFTLNAIRGDCRCARISDCCKLPKNLAAFLGQTPVEWFAQLLFFGIVENVIKSHFDGANRVSLVCACGDDRATLDSWLNKRFVCNGLLIRIARALMIAPLHWFLVFTCGEQT